ncbi:ABC transporter permease [Caulobacter mirabilis]|uniref:ABC-2 type transporter transmembrane domain-containing protein n=1 Tax=Caulobacter mirabilis TaxID=69666 RepID=A0A2D2ATN7_9CAUL|nr:ABC transporter permease [Caulobacter mirabilis]ATQ41374.1 hypothetical protein CSW64_02565 [Caulobacter mirabilis]
MSVLLRIAAREYVAYVRTVGFWLSMLLLPVVAALGGAVPTLMESRSPVSVVAVIDRTGEGVGTAVLARAQAESDGRARPGLGKPPRLLLGPLDADAEDAKAWLNGVRPYPGGVELSAVAILSRGADGGVALDYWSNHLSDPGPRQVVRAAVTEVMRERYLTQRGLAAADLAALDELGPKVSDFSPKAASGEVSLRDRLPGLVGFGAAMLLWSMVLTGAGILLNSVVEEKSSRVLEVLLASASVSEIMFGKILGVLGVTLTVLGVWGVVGAGAMTLLAPTIAADVASVLFGKGLAFYFGFYLIGGYLLYAAIFTAVGAFCETTREAQTLLGPVMAVLVVPVLFMTQAIRRPDSPLLEALSWVPPFTPFLMTARAAGEPPLWQVLGTGALMIATVFVVVWLSGRAFRAGALSTGKVDLKGLLAAVRKGG